MAVTKTNYQKLEENKAAALEFASQIKPSPPPGKDKISEEYLDVKLLVLEGKLDSAIYKLQEIKDNKIGVKWHESKDLGNGTKVLVRDARNMTKDKKLLKIDQGDKYVIQALNQIRAAQTLIDQGQLAPTEAKEAKHKLAYLANTVISDADNLNKKSVKKYNTQMLHVLTETNLPTKQNIAGKETKISLKKQLNFAKDAIMLNDEHKHIVTLTEIQGEKGAKNTCMESEIMLNGLTEGQRDQYSKIENSKIGEKAGVEWFDSMPEYQQKLIRSVAPEILTENKLMPTQFQGKTTGLRNAYQKVTAIQEEGKSDVKILLESLHCGAPAATREKYLDKESKQNISTGNVEQMQSFTPEGSRLNLNIFNSKLVVDIQKGPLAPMAENYIYEGIEGAVKQLGKESDITFTATPINRVRFIGGGRNVDAFEDNLVKMAESLENSKISKQQDLESTVKCLKKGTSTFSRIVEKVTFGAVKTNETKAKLELNKLSGQLDEKLMDSLENSIRARELVDLPPILSNSDNSSLELTTIMNNLVYQAGKGEPKELKLNEMVVNVNFCKSGKDRTGYTELKQSVMAVARHLGIKKGSKKEKEITEVVVNANHSQNLTGTGAGSAGCDSLKTSLAFEMDKSDKEMKEVASQASNMYNRFKTLENEKPAIEEFKQSYNEYGDYKPYQAEFSVQAKSPALDKKIAVAKPPLDKSKEMKKVAELYQKSGIKVDQKYKNNTNVGSSTTNLSKQGPQKNTVSR